MTFGIIIRGKHGPEKSRRFKPHFNRAIVDKANPHGTMIYTEKQYKEELKKKNLVPYNPADYKDKKEKEYTPSDEARYVAQKIKTSNGEGNEWKNFAEKKGFTDKKLSKLKSQATKCIKGKDTTKGGF